MQVANDRWPIKILYKTNVLRPYESRNINTKKELVTIPPGYPGQLREATPLGGTSQVSARRKKAHTCDKVFPVR